MSTDRLNRLSPARPGFRRGGILLLTVVSAMLFLGLLALVIDVGWLYYQHNQLQTAVTAAWRGGYDLMIGMMSREFRALNSTEQTAVKTRVWDILRENGLEEADRSGVRVEFAGEHECPSTLEVFAEKRWGLFFARTLDIPVARVSARRGNREKKDATDFPGSGWVIPLGIPHAACFPLESGISVPKRFGPGEGFTPGTLYVVRGRPSETSGEIPALIDFGGFGDRGDFEKYLSFGFLKPITVGMEVSFFDQDPEAETGRALSARMQSAPWKRVVVIPILAFSPTDVPAKRTKSVVTGFAEFQLTPPPEKSPPGVICGMFQRYLVYPESGVQPHK
jgi:hypothetical protein